MVFWHELQDYTAGEYVEPVYQIYCPLPQDATRTLLAGVVEAYSGQWIEFDD